MDEDLIGLGLRSGEEGEEHLLKDLAHFKDPPLNTQAAVPGRLLGRQAIYESMGAEKYVVEVVEEGYKLQFDKMPPSSYTPNNQSAKQQPQFVREELNRLEQLGCIRRVAKRPYLVLPLSLVYSNKWRLVLDASRGLNPFCTARGTKLDDLSHVAHTVKQGDYLVVNDLDSGYWSPGS